MDDDVARIVAWGLIAPVFVGLAYLDSDAEYYGACCIEVPRPRRQIEFPQPRPPGDGAYRILEFRLRLKAESVRAGSAVRAQQHFAGNLRPVRARRPPRFQMDLQCLPVMTCRGLRCSSARLLLAC